MSKMDFIKKIKWDRNTILICVAAVAIVIMGCLILLKNSHFSMPSLFGVDDNKLGKAAVDYINTSGLSNTPATFVSASEEYGLVKVQLKIGTQTYTSYATKDGKFLFPQAVDMTPKKDAKAAAAKPNTPKATPASLKKSDNPELNAFVVSSCPFGLQMQRAIVEAVKGAPALASNLKVRYIGTVEGGKVTGMHGQGEGDEDLRQICIRDEQPDKFWNYLACYMKKASGTLPNGMPLGDSEGCQASTGVDKGKLAACVKDPKRGIVFAQKDFDMANKNSVSGSPTLILADSQISESDFGGRSADAMRAIICAASNKQPDYCSKKLNTAEASVSFNESYASASGSSANTNCAPAQ